MTSEWRGPALDGLTNSPILLQAKTTSVQNSKKYRMALIVSSNTATTFKYVSQLINDSRSSIALFFGQDAVRMSDQWADQQNFVDSIIFALKDFVAEVVLVNDLAEFKQSDLDFAGVLDVYFTTVYFANSAPDGGGSPNCEVTQML